MEIALSQGQRTIVDSDIDPSLTAKRWFYDHGYAVRTEQCNGRNRKIYLHREILQAGPNQTVDHINGNRLDNRRSNLRICTQAENTQNQRLHCDSRSGYRGVSWCAHTQRWRATIIANKKRECLGRFDDPRDAARAYNTAALRLHGTFARLNPIDES